MLVTAARAGAGGGPLAKNSRSRSRGLRTAVTRAGKLQAARAAQRSGAPCSLAPRTPAREPCGLISRWLCPPDFKRCRL